MDTNNAIQKVEITAEELAEYQVLRAEKAAREAEERAEADRASYRQLERELVDKHFAALEQCSALLAEAKARVLQGADMLIKMKEELFGAKSTQLSHSFMSSCGRYRIKIGYSTRDDWDNTAEDGVRIISDYITANPGADEKAQELASIISEFLTRDKTGRLRLDNIITLERKAQELGIVEIMHGVKIVREAYRPERSKRYVRAERRHPDSGQWVNIPLGMTEA